jgi:hypothetical protein
MFFLLLGVTKSPYNIFPLLLKIESAFKNLSPLLVNSFRLGLPHGQFSSFSRSGFHLADPTIKAFDRGFIWSTRPSKNSTRLSFGRPDHQSIRLDFIWLTRPSKNSIGISFGQPDHQIGRPDLQIVEISFSQLTCLSFIFRPDYWEVDWSILLGRLDIYQHIARDYNQSKKIKIERKFYSTEESVLVRWTGHRPTIYGSDGIRAGSPKTLKKLSWENI